jgi:hypothetical protein
VVRHAAVVAIRRAFAVGHAAVGVVRGAFAVRVGSTRCGGLRREVTVWMELAAKMSLELTILCVNGISVDFRCLVRSVHGRRSR